MEMFTTILLASIALAPVFAQRDILPMETAPGPCPKPETIKNFEPAKLAGTWYDIKRYKNTITRGSCGTATYTWYPDNSSYTVPYEMLEHRTNTLKLTPIDVPSGIFRTNLNGIPTPFDYWLLDTDYDNYHIVYTCIELIPRLLNSQSINIYSRKPTLDETPLNQALNTLTSNKLNIDILRDVEQDNSVCGRNYLVIS